MTKRRKQRINVKAHERSCPIKRKKLKKNKSCPCGR